MRYYLVEWDMDNGEVLTKEPLDVKDLEEALKVLEEIVKDAEKEGWICQETGNGDYICTKQTEDGEVNRQLLIEEGD